MAGSERTGAAHASADLFERSVAIVTPTAQTPAERVDRAAAFWTALGARVLRMSPDDHDRAVAEISHLPHAAASVLAALTDPQRLPLAAGGWLDTTRVASGDAELWRQIFLDNRVHALQALDNFAKVLASFREALAREDSAGLLAILQAGKRNRDSVAS
jgi:prephenate dehydrogenase